MALKQVRDSKDPQPNANNSFRQGGDGQVPVTGEDHGQKKAERVKESQRFTLRTGGESQPTRTSGDGSTPVPADKGEKHGQSKAERIPESHRF